METLEWVSPQFLNTLTGKDVYSPDRTRGVQKYHLTLSSGRVMEFLETPGHQTNALVRNSTLDDMTRGRFDGIINLVDYGYQDSDVIMPSNWSYFSAATCYSTNKLKSALWRFEDVSMSDSMIEAFAAPGQIVYSTNQKKMRVFDETWHNLGQ